MIKSTIDLVNAALHFLGVGIWRIRLREQKGSRGFLIKHLRVLLLAIRGFDEDKCRLRAASLTYFTLLSIVPIVAMAFGVAKGFGMESRLEDELFRSFPEQTDVIEKIVDFAKRMLDSTSGGLIAGIGIVVLFWSVIKVLGNIETSFNDIWGIKTGRTFVRKIGDYLSVMVIGPIMMISSGAITIFIKTQVGNLAQQNDFLAAAGAVVLFGLKFSPYLIVWALFSFIYVFLPNQKVRISSAVIGGIIAGTTYQLVQWGYINSQVLFSKYGAIYGSFAALPLFLIWLNLSWLIVLFGAEISFAHQNVDTYEFEPDCMNASPAFRRLMALRVVKLAVDRFVRQEEPLDAEGMAHEIGIPMRLIRELLFELVHAHVLSEVHMDDAKEPAYQPGVDTDALTIYHVLSRLDHRGTEDIPLTPSEETRKLSESLSRLNEAMKDSAPNLKLKDI